MSHFKNDYELCQKWGKFCHDLAKSHSNCTIADLSKFSMGIQTRPGDMVMPDPFG